jgi:hypothetical protein
MSAFLCVLGILACSATTAPVVDRGTGPTFSGWIRSSTSSVMLRRGGQTVKIGKNSAASRKLYALDELKVADKGTARLVIFGRDVQVPPGTWYRVPEASRDRGDSSVYSKYITLAGRNRGEDADEVFWRAISLSELRNPEAASRIEVDVRMKEITPSGSRLLKPSSSGNYRLPVGSRIVIEMRNRSSVPAFLNLMDIDPSGEVALIANSFENSQRSIPPHSKWLKVSGEFQLELPDERGSGVELLKAIVTSKPIDLTALQTRDIETSSEKLLVDKTQLGYLARIASGGNQTVNIPKWNAASLSIRLYLR